MLGSTNYIPRNVVRLEKLYDLQEKFKKFINCKTNSSSMQFEVVNLGTNTTPQNINLGKNCSPEEKQILHKIIPRNTKTYFPGPMNISRHMTPKSYNTLFP
jgi:hypothetical protein